MDMDSSPEQGASPAGITMGPSPQKYNSDTGTSTSTPQGTTLPTGPEHMRRRDLEIQAMHRKIAELEQKRQAKLAASRTQSPRTLDESGVSSSAAYSSAADAEVAEASTVPSSGPKDTSGATTTILADRPNLVDSFSDSSVRILASMDLTQLEGIRSKILRMKEIETGLPDLDAEIQSSESRLSACREEAEKLLSDITKGREGRLLLVEELKNLSYEINGLSLEDLDELRRQAGIKEQHLAAKEGMENIQDSSAHLVIRCS